ncbi:AAC(3) family N-acetyltransferase [Campylobacter jejuni]|uniref:AAC(3) family N-acetyltransferase n=1 Tax=Campylobacter jejuni TaxID=197 RepID=UPI000F80C87B|nr:AAC(3) family N-acetyltransferase [Campylobacter jejuni]ECL9272947.1 aminoglycoside N(3)-acetyltransferase [Campylobacter jejuni]RTJ23642.1 acetyltransferase [Campylobacter jejuni]RTJ38559.1 acetyltransferase [Campylobacter jejuni]RTJ63298.1 acetyltransferase [Campylobacter jejuni]RTK08299.1 acetyltransferase [Campylobacter jejuni]
MKYFLEHNDKKYSDKDLIDTFYQLGIKRGDILCVHTELFKFGIPLLSRNEFLQTILNCFFEVIGQEGTLIMPTFTYSFCKNEVYDKINSKTKMGALNEYFRKQTGVKRTNDPIFSFAIKGAKEELFLKDTTSCFGENCVYEILTKENGKYIFFGLNEGHALVHYAEEKNTTFCRYFKNFKGILINEEGKEKNITIDYYVRNLQQSYLCDINKINPIIQKTQNYKKINFAKNFIEIYNTKEYVQAICKALTNDKLAIYTKGK